MIKENTFAYEHGILTYHELTIKDRIMSNRDVSLIVPEKKETLQVGSFKREYWLMEQALPVPNSSANATGWKVIQTNLKTQEKPPIEWTYDWIHAPSEHGIYNPLLFGSNLEYRVNLNVDASDIMYFWMTCTKDGRGEFNEIWFDEDKRASLPHPPNLLSKEDYIKIMQMHLHVFLGKDTKTGNVTKLPLEMRVFGLKKSLEHLQGFVSAAHSFADEITDDGRWPKRTMDNLIEEYQEGIENIVHNTIG